MSASCRMSQTENMRLCEISLHCINITSIALHHRHFLQLVLVYKFPFLIFIWILYNFYLLGGQTNIFGITSHCINIFNATSFTLFSFWIDFMQQPELSNCETGHKHAVKMVPTHNTTHQRKTWKGDKFHYLPSFW